MECNKDINKNNINLFHSNPLDIHFLKNLTTDSYCKYFNA